MMTMKEDCRQGNHEIIDWVTADVEISICISVDMLKQLCKNQGLGKQEL